MTAPAEPVDYETPVQRLSGFALVAEQTWALLVDAYRDLNSRALFWIALGLSGFVAGIFALVGFGPEGVSVVGKRVLPFPNSDLVAPSDFYMDLFLTWGVGLWITWAATILALISTAGIVPDLISGGSIDLYLSKPVSRLRLFLTKYVAGLMFVAAQIGLFCLISFLVIGFRGGTWAPSIFIAVPVVTLYYSFLFCIAALIGLVTGSTLAAVLLTLLIWFLLFILNSADNALLGFRTAWELDARGWEARIERKEADVRRWEENPAAAPGEMFQDLTRTSVELEKEVLKERQATLEQFTFWHRLVLGIKAPLPKTNESIEILRRWLVESEELAPTREAEMSEPLTDLPPELVPDDPASAEQAEAGEWTERRARQRQRSSPAHAMDRPEVAQSIQARFGQRGPAWAFGTSLAFEAVILGMCAWIFARRDF